MNIIDLFSGGGGLSEGFKQQGYNIMCHVEMDKAACDTLRTREAYYYLKDSGNLKVYNDYLEGKISKEDFYRYIPVKYLSKVLNYRISQDELPNIIENINELISNSKVDGIIGGPPCQAYSTIGRARNDRIKEKDERIYLYKYYSHFLEEYTPNFFIFENVKGLLSYKDIFNEKLLPKIVEEFERKGYKVDFKLLNSAEYGVPQKRERLFIFGIKSRLEGDAHHFFDHLLKYKERSININDLFFDLPTMSSGETINLYSSKHPNSFVEKNLRSSNVLLSQNISRPNNKRDKSIYKLVVKAKNSGQSLKYNELPSNLKTHKNEKNFLDRFKCLNEKEQAHTLVAHISKDGHYYIHPDIKQNRSITVREAARIQTFPDDYYFENSRTSAFKQIGNAVPVYLSGKIAKTIRDILEN
ncbi:TPA: DNA cytosine methyltransferase [Enterococcus faecalis]|uniref:DNA cytosine methyltransferase n=1 Tax=Enterococcus faecalis TaxID=1351 RepID=UPI000CF2AC3D|nr:DNA cytosine methyltransferase [Enterococcus faecalis]EHR4813386.1 DNA cytosine methyltransferase [Enterococcus faecalis]PQE72050.1 DNA (cytosine-5-)-methyltransferase [Enterococcus faecalis]PQF05421.1 DNA (cytosine-5-)-methyltransferase [Enterococcus faecalis]RXV92917.1 DNA (cytosine-5-)-methyltransferase [Enterococcus faecalis]HED9419396.1 DNA cytosine methyltransferase [Enterococcus faecalis]